MFERYTDKARGAIFLARHEASKTRAHGIETSHLLLGVVCEHPHFLGDVQASATFIEKYRLEITSDQGEEIPTSVDMPLSHACKRALEYGMEEANEMGRHSIAAEHLFLGLLREDCAIAARMARDYGIEMSSFRERVAKAE